MRIESAPGNVRAAHATFAQKITSSSSKGSSSNSANRSSGSSDSSSYTGSEGIVASGISRDGTDRPDLRLVYGLVISPVFRHRGLGAALLEAAAIAATVSSTAAARGDSLATASNQADSYIYLSCCGGPLVNFYEKQCGFTRCASELRTSSSADSLKSPAEFPTEFASNVSSAIGCGEKSRASATESVVWMRRRF